MSPPKKKDQQNNKKKDCANAKFSRDDPLHVQITNPIASMICICHTNKYGKSRGIQKSHEYSGTALQSAGLQLFQSRRMPFLLFNKKKYFIFVSTVFIPPFAEYMLFKRPPIGWPHWKASLCPSTWISFPVKLVLEGNSAFFQWNVEKRQKAEVREKTP